MKKYLLLISFTIAACGMDQTTLPPPDTHPVPPLPTAQSHDIWSAQQMTTSAQDYYTSAIQDLSKPSSWQYGVIPDAVTPDVYDVMIMAVDQFELWVRGQPAVAYDAHTGAHASIPVHDVILPAGEWVFVYRCDNATVGCSHVVTLSILY